MDMSKYKEMFISEAKEHLQSISRLIVSLEKDPNNEEDIQALFRSAHSVKGMAASMGYSDVADLSHKMEDMMDLYRKGEKVFSAEAADLILEGLDALELMIKGIDEDKPSGVDVSAITAKVATIKDLGATATEEAPKAIEEAAPKSPVVEAGPPAVAEAENRLLITVEVAGSAQLPGMRGFLVYKRLGEAGQVTSSEPELELIKKGEFKKPLVFRLHTGSDIDSIKKLLSTIPELRSIDIKAETAPQANAAEGTKPAMAAKIVSAKTVRVSTDLLDKLINIVGEMVTSRSSLMELGKEIDSPALKKGHLVMGSLISKLHNQVLSVRMTPVDSLMDRLPRVVRDIARKSGKKVELRVEGKDIELDRVIIEEMADPLVHIIRNCVDHGIELPKDRSSAGKPEKGLVTIRAMRERDQVILNINDDGRGINAEKIRTKAIEKGILTQEKAAGLDDRDIYILVCHPGLSTAEKVTDVSGRGVGMDAVKNSVDSMGGSLDIDSAPGKGTGITIKLPLSVAIIQVLLVKVGSYTSAIPINKVIQTLEVEKSALKRSQRKLAVMLEEELVPLFSMREVLGAEKADDSNRLISIVITEMKNKKVGLVVDGLVGQQEAFIKPLDPPLMWTKGLSGATILGNGSVIFVLDIPNLL
ncbi:MAG: chemotaxis protein CheA [Proteobacteria bacterium]|nr:chemotaxis protein CheA [Pseudomonadota bacterium]